uniref:transposase n=1 Tax=Brunnivagina elsteri TaxID=1247191 RepID=UPI001FE79BB4|nr:transposase [Calothrix elsteri]
MSVHEPIVVITVSNIIQKKTESFLVEVFLESYPKPPRQITIDLDVTDDIVHGNQEEVFYNTYYGNTFAKFMNC